MRSAEAGLHAEALRRPDGDVRPHRARFLDQAQREQVGVGDRQRADLMQRVEQRRVVAQFAVRAGVGDDRAEPGVVGLRLLDGPRDQVDAVGRRAGREHGPHLRVQVVGDEEPAPLAAGVVESHHHGLGGRGRLVEQRRARHLEAGQVDHHGLEVQQRLEAALRDLRLVGRVGRVPGGVLQDVALDGRRGDRPVVALADHRRVHDVARPEAPKLLEHRALRHGGPAERPVLAEAARHGLVDEVVERIHPERAEHGVHLGRAGADVAPVGEVVGVVGGGLPGWHRLSRSSRGRRPGPSARRAGRGRSGRSGTPRCPSGRR